ncbi:HLH DNA binding domain protein [Aspergillus terreus]|uniref:HLH DNA binding domain protein n=1 Tax=Aspergillus terreus TaxID=33178 RepID=A0A5M3YVV5_ASPTE|nr:hypothetical protein ATETN484_0004024700 [Aspergillus terreus]GFF13137.1 HLH DNA binding domain protein [Aspergillus terreus]
MAYSRQDSTGYALDSDYMTSPLHRPMDAFPGKGPDPLSGNWNYDSAIDLFSLNTTTMLPEPLQLDIPNEFVNLDPKEFPAEFFAPPPEFSGFTISNHGEDVASCGSISSDLESDDQSWSPSYIPPTELSNALPEPARRNTDPHVEQKPQERAQRWSSSPDLAPQEYSTAVSPPPAPATLPASTTRKMARSLSGDSSASTGATTASGRNAAKRAAHNIIEKRYRTNMNAKFVALEKAMCGGVQKPSKGGSASLKKSEILTNAINYMQELQEENKALRKEMEVMKQNMMWRRT